MTVHKELKPFLEEFQKANGKGNIANANLALMRIIEVLASHIERQSSFNSFGTIYSNLTPDVTPIPVVYPPPGLPITEPSPPVESQAEAEDQDDATVDALESPQAAVRKKPGRKPKALTDPAVAGPEASRNPIDA